MKRAEALDALSQRLVEEDLREIAFLLDAHSAITDRASRREIARELLEYCYAKNKLPELARNCKAKEPAVDWDNLLLTAEPAPLSSPTTPAAPTTPPPAPPLNVPVIGIWNVTTMFGFVGTTAYYPTGAFQVNSPQGQANGQWGFNPAIGLLQYQGWMNGMPIAGALSIQQWLPNGFVALGADGLMYTFIRAG
jgi:hypothetical protein